MSERIQAICDGELEADALRRQALEILRAEIGFDAYVWLLTDPITTVGAAPLADIPCLPELPKLIKEKYSTSVNRWTLLQQGQSPVGLLADAVGGDLAQSRVWTQVLSRYGIGDISSVVFTDQFGCWGFLDLWRENSRERFDRYDAELLAALAGPLTAGLRGSQARTFIEPATPYRRDLGPVVLILDDDLRINSRTAASGGWLDMLLPSRPDAQAILASVYNVAAQLLAAENGIDHHAASARVHLADGFWLTLRAARLAPDESPAAARSRPVVVTIEESSASERLELFARAFGFTPREQDLAGLLATGGDTRLMARRLAVSENTIQDHLKSMFARTGARDRISVLARALGTQREFHRDFQT